MSISGQNLSIVIVTLKSEKVIHNCIKSIDKNIPIIVVENSSNLKFKNELENTYNNVSCILSHKNLGMGSGNNIGIKLAKTNYVLVLNPDVIFEHNTLEELYRTSEEVPDFCILSPLCIDSNFPNYRIDNKQDLLEQKETPFKVDFVDGFAMLFDKKKFKNDEYFDEKYFMYLENDDLCLRVKKHGGSIFVLPKSKIKHLGASAVDKIYNKEIELSRNWHWVWSKFYFNKKNFGIFKALKECLLSYFTAIIKFLFFSILNNDFKKKIYFNRASGFFNALIGKPSWYRPKLED